MTHHFTITSLNTSRRRVAVLSVVILIGWLVALPRPAFATNRTWLPTSGNWNVNGNWSGGSVPTATDNAIIGNGRTASVPVTASGTVGGLTIGDSSGAGSLIIQGGLVHNDSGSLFVGYSGTGNLNINGGTMTNSWSVISAKPGTSGTVTITSGTFSNSSSLQVGYGSGALNINGGFVSNATASFGWNVGDGNIGTGSAAVTGGTWNNTTLIVGETGQGFLNISGGIVNSITGYIGRSGSSIGIATVTGGTWDNSSALYVGNSGTGTLTVGGTGVVNVENGSGTLVLANKAGSVGTLNMGDGNTVGTLNVAGISVGSGTATVNFNHTGNYTSTQDLTGNLSINKLGSGTTILNSTNNYTGSTTVSEGELDVNGSLAGGGMVTVAIGATLSGSGTVSGAVAVNGTLRGSLHTGAISGSGLVSPGNSPGILTAPSVDVSSGMAFALEFTLANTNPIYSNALASGNDILHLTGASPFSGNLTADNLISIYLQSATVGDTYQGGFFTNLNDAQLQEAIENAKFAFFVEDAANGTIAFNGKKYSSMDAALITLGAIQITGADFADGTVNGSELRLRVIPEPSMWAMLTGGIVLMALSQRHKIAEKGFRHIRKM